MRTLLVGGFGYIGSRIWQDLSKEFDFEILDLGLRGKPKGFPEGLQIDYSNIDKRRLREYEAVVVFAGASSVQASLADPYRALNWNVASLYRLAEAAENSRFIYASSGSVYDGSRGLRSSEDEEISPSRNPYDLSKITFDRLMQISGDGWTGLRLGTVCGPSPNLRFDLMANKMVADALTKGEVFMSNRHANRAILSISDLTGAVRSILSAERHSFGLLNLCSFNSTVGEVAQAVAEATGADIREGPSGPTYDFSMSTAKAEDALRFMPEKQLGDLVGELTEFFRGKGKEFLIHYASGITQ